MKVEELAIFFGHLMETALRQLIVIVVMADRCVCHSLGEGPKPIQLHVFTHFHSDAGNHQASGQAVCIHTFSSPETGKLFQVLGMEKENLLFCFRLLECVVHFKGGAGVDSVGKCWKKEECVSVGCNILQKFCFLL